MPDKVFTIYAIGTGHNYTEKYNTLVTLCDTTAADYKILITRSNNVVPYLGTRTKDQPTSLKDGWEKSDQVCVLVDGPSLNATAHNYFISQVNKLKDLIKKYEPKKVNAVGHSRGAILTIYLTNILYNTKVIKDKKCSLFLIDPVKRSDLLDEFGLILALNINNYKRIIMEDDYSQNIFPLQTITSCSYEIKQLDNIRLPGAHGTATQCSPLVSAGYLVPNVKLKLVSSEDGENVWPIGLCAYRSIKSQLIEWGTWMEVEAMVNNITKFDIIDAYAAIITNNLSRYRDGKYVRTLNNIAYSKPDEKQKIDNVVSTRQPKDLNDLCPNPYRGGPLFINEQHKDLFKSAFPILYGCFDQKDITTFKYYTMSKQGQTVMINEISHSLSNHFDDVRKLRIYCPSMYTLFVKLGIITV